MSGMTLAVRDALKELGKSVYCLHLELEPSIANEVQARFDALVTALRGVDMIPRIPAPPPFPVGGESQGSDVDYAGRIMDKARERIKLVGDNVVGWKVLLARDEEEDINLSRHGMRVYAEVTREMTLAAIEQIVREGLAQEPTIHGTAPTGVTFDEHADPGGPEAR